MSLVLYVMLLFFKRYYLLNARKIRNYSYLSAAETGYFFCVPPLNCYSSSVCSDFYDGDHVADYLSV